MTRRTRATLLGGALMILGGCARLDTLTTLAPPTPSTTTTAMVATTTSPPATPESGPESGPTSSTSSSSPPPVDDTAALRADAAATWETSHRCLATPEQCDVGAVAIAASPADAQLRQRLDDLVREGFRAVPGSGPLQLVIESAEMAGDGSGVVVACVTDGVVLMDVADPADPLDDIVFDDSLGSYRWRWVMQRTDAGWRRQTVEQLGYYPGVERCPA